MKKLIVFVIVCLSFNVCHAQEGDTIRGFLGDCAQKSPLIIGNVYLIQGTEVVDTAVTGLYGRFQFIGITDGQYTLKTDYFYYPAKTIDLTIPSSKPISICLDGRNPDSLLAAYTLKEQHTMFLFGLSFYSDDVILELGEEYGVDWVNMGCILDERFDNYNAMVEFILTKRNGVDWLDRHWDEAAAILKK